MRKILLLYTGGTIGMVKDYKTRALKPLDFDNIVNQIPELSLLDVSLTYTSISHPVDSSDMNLETWQDIALSLKNEYESYDGFVVLHGTDTMAYTASALSFMLSGLQKPVIFTGSQLPVGDLRTDAKENLLTSIHYAALHCNTIKEVCIYFEYKLYRANRTTKISAEQFDAFDSPNFPCLGVSGVHLNLNESILLKNSEVFTVDTNMNPHILLIKLYPALDMSMYQCILQNQKVRVVILEAFGSGNMFSGEAMDKFFEVVESNDIAVVVITQCSSGAVRFGKYESSKMFLKYNAISGFDLTTEAAVTKAMYLAYKCNTRKDFQETFPKNLRGEMTSAII